MNKPNEAWKKVEGYLRECIVLSFLVAAVAHALVALHVGWFGYCLIYAQEIIGIMVPGDFGTVRAFAYLIIGYMVVVPVYFFRSLNAFKNSGVKVVKKFTLISKFLWTISAFLCIPSLIIFPFYFLLSNNYHQWRIKVVHDLVTKYYVGLSLLGGAMLWIVVICFLVFFCVIPMIWVSRSKEDVKDE